MARTGTDENKQANAQADAVQQDQIARANAATTKYNSDLATLKSGQTIAANPWSDPNYLRAQNLKMSAASSGATDASADQLNREAQRTGENTAARGAAILEAGRQKSRDMSTMQAGQSADDYNRFQAYQSSLLANDLAPAGTSVSLYGDATQGRNAALNNLTSIGNAQQAMWGNIIGAGLQAGGAVGAKAV